jgi:hypothetical protein
MKAALVRDGQVFQEATHPSDAADFEHFPGSGTGVYVRGRITDPTAAAQIKKGNLGGLSYIANLKKYEPLPGGGRRFLELDPWLESTVAAYPINPEAVITVAKAFGLKETTDAMQKNTAQEPSLEEILAELGQTLQEKEAGVTKADLKELFDGFTTSITGAFEAAVSKALVPVRGEGTGRVGQVETPAADPRETDPVAYIIEKAKKDDELDPQDKDLAVELFKAALAEGMKA